MLTGRCAMCSETTGGGHEPLCLLDNGASGLKSALPGCGQRPVTYLVMVSASSDSLKGLVRYAFAP